MTAPLDRLAAALADRYKIERELGQGGMATVYLAEDVKHHRKVAVKVLRPELAATMGSDRFAREIEVAARLTHPHILGLIDSGDAEGFFYYVMPYVEGETLRDRLARAGELPVPDTVRLLGEIADALAVAHHAGVVHRDIKPENILLSGRHAMVMDFGVAKAVTEASGRQQLTTAGVALGTPAYMAPEQATADPHLDGRVDIYALGVVGYEMLTGHPPFHGLDPQQTLAAHVTQAPVVVGQQRPGLSPALESVVMRCLAKRPADRWQTADELVAALEPLATPSGGMTPTHTKPIAVVAAAAGPPRRLAYGVGVAALVAVLGWVGWRALKPGPSVIRIANIRQVSREPEPEIHVAISPDGQEVAYQSGYANSPHIVVRDVTGGRPLPLTGDWQGAQLFPAWMPDGRSITFLNAGTTTDHEAGPWKLPRLGGQAVALDSADQLLLNRGFTIVVRGDSAFARRADRGETLLRAGLQGLHSAVWRMDGSALAYVVGNTEYLGNWGNVAPSEIWVTPIGGTPVRVTDSTSLNVSPAWLPDGTLLFVSNRDGARDIYAVRLDRSGAPRERPLRLTTGLEAYSVAVSADGRTAAYDRFILRRNIYAIPIPKSGSVSLRDARAITTGSQTIENLDLSADGKWLAFDSNIEGNQEIFVMPAGGGEPRQVTRGPGDNFSPDFSPDGREITFHSTRNATRDIYVINTDGSGEQRLSSDGEQSYHPAFSPDGLSIAYGNTSGTIDLLHRDARAAPWQAPKRLSIDTGFAPRWSPDGSRLTYDIRTDRGGIGIFPLGGTARMVIAGRGLWPDWSVDGQLIYFRAKGPDNIEGVYAVAANRGTPRLLVRFDDPAQSVFPGSVLVGNGMFYFAVGEVESDIYVMDLETPWPSPSRVSPRPSPTATASSASSVRAAWPRCTSPRT
ncbi:MAG TPA: protein kinase [Gemmatimonadales bacterium]